MFLKKSWLIFLLFVFLLLGYVGITKSNSTETKLATEGKNQYHTSGNPAAVYCTEVMGYEYRTKTHTDGSQDGFCVLPDKSECEQWDFYAGTCGAEYSYCVQEGYELETRDDGQDPFSSRYATCIVKDGQLAGTALKPSSLFDLMPNTETELDISDVSLPPENLTTADAVPISWDWRNVSGLNWLTAIRNQSTCGGCWSFAALGVTEAYYNIISSNPNLDLNLSEQELISCSSAGTCNGGWTPNAFAYIRDVGVSDEACMPYTASNSSCSKCGDWASRLTSINNYSAFIPDQTLIKNALVTYGPVYASMGWDYGGYFDGDIYRCTEDNGTPSSNHAIVIVGYNDAGGYWLVRNSWGTGFENGGYFKVGYNECYIDRRYAGYVYNVPPAPTGISASDGTYTDKVSLNWNASPSSTYYKVFRNTSNTPSGATTLTSNDSASPFDDTSATVGTTYYYWVKACNSSGCSTYSSSNSGYRAIVDDNYEENDTFSTAYTSLNEQTWLNSIDGYGLQFDDDWYRIQVYPDTYRNVEIDIQFTHSEGDINVCLYNSSSTALRCSTSTTNEEHIDYIVPSEGYYYVRIYGANQGNQYNLWWDDLFTPQTIVINEVNPETPDAIEFFNFGTKTVDMTGWVLQNYRSSNLYASYTFPSFSLSPGAYVVVHEYGDPVNNTAVDLYTGANINWVNDDGAAALLNNSGSDMDFVQWGTSSVTPPSGTSWSGTNPITAASTSNSTLGRDNTSTDTDAGSDWCAQLTSLGKVNNGCSPINDDFDNALDLNTVSPMDTRGTYSATQDTNDPVIPNCNMNAGRATVWYKYTPTTNTAISLDTKNSNYDTFIAVWTGTRTNLSPVVCNDDIDHANGVLQSAVAFRVQANVTYYIEVGEWDWFYSEASANELGAKERNPAPAFPSDEIEPDDMD